MSNFSVTPKGKCPKCKIEIVLSFNDTGKCPGCGIDVVWRAKPNTDPIEYELIETVKVSKLFGTKDRK